MTVARLLAFSCVLALAGPASAKDRPLPKRDEPAKATGCEYLGGGYVKAPGSDTCIKIDGSVRAETAIFSR